MDTQNPPHLVEDRIADYYDRGVLVEGCIFCEKTADEWRSEGGSSMPMAPSHKASPLCASGSLPHCTCDTCF